MYYLAVGCGSWVSISPPASFSSPVTMILEDTSPNDEYSFGAFTVSLQTSWCSIIDYEPVNISPALAVSKYSSCTPGSDCLEQKFTVNLQTVTTILFNIRAKAEG